MPSTLGDVTKSTFLKEVEQNKIHHEFEVQNTTGTITFDADLIAANQVDGSIDGVAIAPVTFLTDHDTTMDLLVTELLAHAAVESVTLTDAVNNRQLTIVPVDKAIAPALTLWAVTAGAGQAGTVTASDLNTIHKGEPVKLTSDGKVEPLGAGLANLDYIGIAIHDGLANEMVTIAMRAYSIIWAEADAALSAGPVKFEAFTVATSRLRYNDGSITTINFTGWALDDAAAVGDEIRVAIRP